MDDEAESRLLAELRKQPGDEGTRLVYADWLDQHGHAQLAEFVRGNEANIASISNLEWRAITSCTKLECERSGCPRTWNKLATTDRTRIRRCTECDQFPLYCAKPSEADRAGWKRIVIAFDIVDRPVLERHYDRGVHPWKYGTYNPPPPGTPLPPPKPPFETALEVLDEK